MKEQGFLDRYPLGFRVPFAAPCIDIQNPSSGFKVVSHNSCGFHIYKSPFLNTFVGATDVVVRSVFLFFCGRVSTTQAKRGGRPLRKIQP